MSDHKTISLLARGVAPVFITNGPVQFNMACNREADIAFYETLCAALSDSRLCEDVVDLPNDAAMITHNKDAWRSHGAGLYIASDRQSRKQIGLAGFCKFKAGEATDISDLAVVCALLPEYRGCGYGQAILRTMRAVAGRFDVETIKLVFPATDAAALRLAEKDDGTQIGTLGPDGAYALYTIPTCQDYGSDELVIARRTVMKTAAARLKGTGLDCV